MDDDAMFEKETIESDLNEKSIYLLYAQNSGNTIEKSAQSEKKKQEAR